MKSIVYYPYVEGVVAPQSLRATVKYALARPGCWIRPQICKDAPLSYAKGLSDIWGIGADIIIIEHDIVPTVEQFNELVDCQESSVCSWDYSYPGCESWASNTLKERAKGANIPNGLTSRGYASSDANNVAFGFIKIGRAAQTVDVPIVHWKILASTLSRKLPEVHIHGLNNQVVHRPNERFSHHSY